MGKVEIYLTEYVTIDEAGSLHKYGGEVIARSWEDAEALAAKSAPPQTVIGILDSEIREVQRD